jgi:hypothetical protein
MTAAPALPTISSWESVPPEQIFPLREQIVVGFNVISRHFSHLSWKQ